MIYPNTSEIVEMVRGYRTPDAALMMMRAITRRQFPYDAVDAFVGLVDEAPHLFEPLPPPPACVDLGVESNEEPRSYTRRRDRFAALTPRDLERGARQFSQPLPLNVIRSGKVAAGAQTTLTVMLAQCKMQGASGLLTIHTGKLARLTGFERSTVRKHCDQMVAVGYFTRLFNRRSGATIYAFAEEVLVVPKDVLLQTPRPVVPRGADLRPHKESPRQSARKYSHDWYRRH